VPELSTTLRERLWALKNELVEQGRLVQRTIELAAESVFDRSPEKAKVVRENDDTIDRVDVRIEKDAVRLLADIVRTGEQVEEYDLRMILTVVKVNNEFERIADLAVAISDRVDSFVAMGAEPPPTFRVMANSVIGIMSTTVRALGQMDTSAARLVLSSDDATEAFKQAILRDVEEGLARGRHTVDYAFGLNQVGTNLARMADHCTNVAEQVIYVETGKIVRHMGDHWTAPTEPGV